MLSELGLAFADDSRGSGDRVWLAACISTRHEAGSSPSSSSGSVGCAMATQLGKFTAVVIESFIMWMSKRLSVVSISIGTGRAVHVTSISEPDRTDDQVLLAPLFIQVAQSGAVVWGDRF